jgi:hypothetical protein
MTHFSETHADYIRRVKKNKELEDARLGRKRGQSTSDGIGESIAWALNYGQNFLKGKTSDIFYTIQDHASGVYHEITNGVKNK